MSGGRAQAGVATGWLLGYFFAQLAGWYWCWRRLLASGCHAQHWQVDAWSTAATSRPTFPACLPACLPACPACRSFLRFPGGCYVEGDWMRNAFRWKESAGGNEARTGHMNGGWASGWGWLAGWLAGRQAGWQAGTSPSTVPPPACPRPSACLCLPLTLPPCAPSLPLCLSASPCAPSSCRRVGLLEHRRAGAI